MRTRATRVSLLWVLFVCGCDPASVDGGDAAPTETVIQTQGNKESAVVAVRFAAGLDEALERGDLNEVRRLAFAIARLAGDIALAPPLGYGGSRTPFSEPVPPPQPAGTGCDSAGCTFNHYRDPGIYSSLNDGIVRVQEVAGTRSIEIALRSSETTSATLDPTTYVNGTLQVSESTVTGAVTDVTTYPDRREEPESVRFESVTFDRGADPITSATPLSGSVAGEWTSAEYDTGVYTTRFATVPFP